MSAGELLSRQERKDIALGHGQQSLEGSRLLIFTAPDPTGLSLPWGRGPESQRVEVTMTHVPALFLKAQSALVGGSCGAS